MIVAGRLIANGTSSGIRLTSAAMPTTGAWYGVVLLPTTTQT